jgi:hypothetical protein
MRAQCLRPGPIPTSLASVRGYVPITGRSSAMARAAVIGAITVTAHLMPSSMGAIMSCFTGEFKRKPSIID